MPPLFTTPFLARLLARIARLVPILFVSVLCMSPAHAATIPEIQRLMKQGSLPQALARANAYIAANPKDAEGYFFKGLILSDMGRTADAISVYTMMTEDFPELPEPHNNLAVLYARKGQYDRARMALEMAIRTHPSYAAAHENLGDIYATLARQAYERALQTGSARRATAQTKLTAVTSLISAPERPAERVEIARIDPVEPPTTETKPDPQKQPPEVEQPETATEQQQEKKIVPLKEDVVKTLHAWANAWSRQDVNAYLGFYAQDFQTPGAVPRRAWESERRQRVEGPDSIQVTLSNIGVSMDEDKKNKATVRFRQQYRSPTFNASTNKTIVFVRSGERWLILQERVN